MCLHTCKLVIVCKLILCEHVVWVLVFHPFIAL